MAQGKLKVKSKKPDLSSKKGAKVKTGKVVKKGRKEIPSKKGSQLEMQKVKKSIQKNINKNIETQLAQRAHQLEEGKGFRILQNPQGSKKKGKK